MEFDGKCIECGSKSIVIEEDTYLAVMTEGFLFTKNVTCESCGKKFKIQFDGYGIEPDKVVEA